MSTLMPCSASGPKMAAATPGRSLHAQHGDPRLVPAVGDPADDLAFHDLILVHDQRAGPVLEARQHLHPDLVLHGQRHGARLQHLGPERGHLQHLLVGDALELARLGDDARVGRVDAVDVGEDVAALRLQRRRQRHGRGVRAAAAERRDPPVRAHALEAGDHGDPAGVEAGRTGSGSTSRMRALLWASVGGEAGLPAQERARRHADGLQRDRQQPDRHLLAAGDHLVVLGRVVAGGVQAVHPAHQLVGRSRPWPRRRPPPGRPRATWRLTRAATLRMRSGSATEVPPYFCTTSVTGKLAFRVTAPQRPCEPARRV